MSPAGLTVPLMKFFLRPDGRTYTVFPAHEDLLGDVVLVTVHGSIRNRLGGIKTYVARSFSDAEKIEAGIVATRLRHGYVPA